MTDPAAHDGASGPLAGVRILDLTRALSGPFATLMLGGLGATVIKIEEPRADSHEKAPFFGRDGTSLRRLHEDDISIGHVLRNRGKRSLTLNLKHPEAAGIFERLVPHFDVVVENYTRGTSERLGVGYSAASRVKSDIIYCSISGFGQEGTPGGGKALDTVIQAMSGAMMTSGSPGEAPVRVGVPMADLSTPLFATIGIISALYHHQKTGEGQYIDVSMLGSLTALQTNEPFKILEDLGVPMRTGPTMPRLAPFGIYPASDGNVVLCCSGDRNFKLLTALMGAPELADDPRFLTQVDRIHNYAELDDIVRDWTRQRTVKEINALLDEADIANAPVRTPDEANRDPRVLSRGEVVKLKHPIYGETAEVFAPGVPIKFSRTEAKIDPGSADLGEDNASIYGDLLGVDKEELARMRRDKVISNSPPSGDPAQAVDQLRRIFADRLAPALAHKAAGGQVIAYLCDNVPIELIVAAGAFPLRIHPQPGEGTATAKRLVDPLYPPEVTQRPDFVASMLGRILEGTYAFVDAVIVPHNRNAIQAIHRELADAQSEHRLDTPPTWYLDKAWSPHGDARAYNRRAVEKLLRTIEAHVGRAIGEADLAAAAAEVERARRAIRALSERRKQGQLPGSLAIELMGAFWCLPPAHYADLAEAAVEQLRAQPAEPRRRVYLGGSPVDQPGLYRLIEGLGAAVVDEDHCWGSRAGDLNPAGEGSALAAIAERFHSLPACSIRVPLQRTVDANTSRAVNSGAGAAILYVMEGDAAQVWETPAQVTAMEEAGLRVLHLHNQPHDAADSVGLAERIGAFLDSVDDA